MTCACKPPKPIAARGLQEDAAFERQRPKHFEVAGTWDYKWPLGTTIRVAFQTPPQAVHDGPLRQIQDIVKDLANRWNEAGANIYFEFIDEWLDPPMGDGSVPGSEQKSPFILNDSAKSIADRHKVLFKYDVLISFQDLPLDRIDPFKSKSAGAASSVVEHVKLPLAELGSYARRADYGAPTMYLGRFGRSEDMSLCDYLTSSIGQHIVVHEFGHVLGLAHEHQNPNYAQREDLYRPTSELQVLVKEIYGLSTDVTAREIEVQIREEWPGNPQFSDWDEEVISLRNLHSVMTFPGHRYLLKSSKEEERDIEYLTEPTEVDLRNLRRMYPHFMG
jgi:hypothetical protein